MESDGRIVSENNNKTYNCILIRMSAKTSFAHRSVQVGSVTKGEGL